MATILEGSPLGSALTPTRWIDVTPIDSGDESCVIEKLDIQAHVSGLYATVSETITIRNPNIRPISVDLSISMPDDAVVCGYALEIDGKLRDGVVVPKETARVAFETERRRGVDPGLVEAVKGNLYKTRVYPIDALGDRKVRLDYVAPLSVSGGDAVTMGLPLPADPVGQRHVRIEVEMPESERPAITGLVGSDMQDVSGVWVVESTVEDEAATQPVTVTLPSVPSPLVMMERTAGGDGEGSDVWFLVSERVPEAGDGDAADPEIKSVTVLWDASGSRAASDHAAEIGLATRYCEGAESITLVTFSNAVSSVTDVASADALAEALGAVRYDGGTDLPALAASLPDVPGACDGVQSGSVCVLFSDGMDTLSEGHLALPDGCDMLAVVSGEQRDMEALRQACKGHAFPLAKAPADAAALAHEFSPAVTSRRLALVGTGVADVVDAGFVGSGRRCALGRLTAGSTEIQLGDGGENVALDATEAHDGETLSRAWAARRVTVLSPRAADNSDELMRIGRRFGVASPVSSLLVLESLDQWLRYDVRPPESWEEMRSAYDAARPGQMRLQGEREKADRHIAAVEEEWQDLLVWHDKEFPEPRDEVRFPFRRESPTLYMSASEGMPESAPDSAPESAPVRFASRMRSAAESVGERISGLRRSVFSVPDDDALFSIADEGSLGYDDTGVFYDAAPAGAMMRSASLDGFAAADMDIDMEEMAAPVAASEPVDGSATAGEPDAKPSLVIRPWMPDTPYLSALDEAFGEGLAAAEDAYARLRPEYVSSPSFFLDVAGWFVDKGDREFGLRVLSNLAEVDVDNAAFLRILGWRLREAGLLDEAAAVLRKVLALRSEDSQSHRDLALVLSELAREEYADGCQADARAHLTEAADLYRKIAETPWARRAVAVSLFAVEELNVMRAWASSVEWEDGAPEIAPVTEKLDGVLDCDLRITLAWDADDTDIDIHVTEPSGEEAYYGHRRTYMGGRVSEDITDGYGPELYEIRKAESGTYVIRAHYYASHQQTVFGPATCTLTVYTDWGREGQSQVITTTRLDKERAMVPVGTASYGEAPAADDGQDGGADAPASSQVSVGMSEEELVALLGEPDSRVTEGGLLGLMWKQPGGRILYAFLNDDGLIKFLERTSWGDESVIVQ